MHNCAAALAVRHRFQAGVIKRMEGCRRMCDDHGDMMMIRFREWSEARSGYVFTWDLYIYFLDKSLRKRVSSFSARPWDPSLKIYVMWWRLRNWRGEKIYWKYDEDWMGNEGLDSHWLQKCLSGDYLALLECKVPLYLVYGNSDKWSLSRWGRRLLQENLSYSDWLVNSNSNVNGRRA